MKPIMRTLFAGLLVLAAGASAQVNINAPAAPRALTTGDKVLVKLDGDSRGYLAPLSGLPAALPAFTGDCTKSLGGTVLTCTKANGVLFGAAAFLDIGTGSGTVAAGNDSRFADAAALTTGTLPIARIADGAIGTAKLGSDITSFGKTFISGDAAAGRTGLGLGGAATLNVGTGSGTVAAGNDSRFSDAASLSTGTLNAARLPSSGVTPGTYGTATQVPRVTVDTYGRVTAATTVAVSAPTGYLLSAITASNTAEQNRVALLADIKTAIANKQGLYLSCGGDCAVGEIEISGVTNNSTTAALAEGAKLHIVIDDNTVIKTQLGQKFIDINLADTAVTMSVSAMSLVAGTNTVSTTVADPPFYLGRYMRLTVPDAMVNSGADPTTVINKYDMVTLQDDTPQINNEDGVNEGFQAEDFEVLETVEVAGSADDYVYISIPLKTYNPATTRLHLWKNKDTEFSVTGGRFKGDPLTGDFESKTLTRPTTTSIVFDVMGVKAPLFRDIRVGDTFTGFAQIQHSMLLRVDNVQGERARNQSTPTSPDYRALSYMFDLYGANKNFSITNSGGNGWRHVFTTNHAQSTSYSSGSWPLYGETVGGHIDGYRGTFNQGGSIDTHDPSYGITISNAVIMSPVEYTDGIISPRCLSDRAATTTYRNIQCYGAFSLLTMDGWKLNHGNADNVTTLSNAAFMRPMHVPRVADEDLPVIEAPGRSGISERRKLLANNVRIEDFGIWLQMDGDAGEVVMDNFAFNGDIYRVSSTGRSGVNVGTNNKLTIKNTTLDFRNANIYDQTLTINNSLIKAFGALTGNVELTLENVTILGCSKFDNGGTHYLFANDGTGTKTVRYRNFYCDDPDVVISGGTGLTLVNMDPAPAAGASYGLPPPSQFGLKDWTFPPIAATVSPTMSAGVGYASRLRFVDGGTATGLRVICTSAGVSLTGVYVALYALDGTRLAVSADVSSDFTTTGEKNVAFTAPVAGIAAGTELIAAILFSNGAGTAPRVASGTQQQPVAHSGQNTTLGSAQLRQHFFFGSGQSTLPSPLSGISSTGTTVTIWAGLY